MNSWFWLAILASLFWGLTYVIDQYLLRYLDPLAILFISVFLITLVLGGYFALTHQWQSLIKPFAGGYTLLWAMLAYTFFYFIATVLILKSVNAGNASLSAIIESAYPLFTIPFAYLILREVQFNWGVLAGTGFILMGLVIVQVAHGQ